MLAGYRSPADKLKLFPTTLANPHGTKATTYEWVSAQHRAWVKNLPRFLVPTVIAEDGNRVTTMQFDRHGRNPALVGPPTSTSCNAASRCSNKTWPP